MDLWWCVSSGGGRIVNGGGSSELEDDKDEELVLATLFREPYVILTPPVDFPPIDAVVEAKPAHFVFRGRRILWILEVVRCVPVDVEDGGDMMTAYEDGKSQSSTFSSRVARDQAFLSGVVSRETSLLYHIKTAAS